MPRCRRRPILAPTYQTSGGALLCTSETPKPVASRLKVGGGAGVHLLFAFAPLHLLFFYKHSLFLSKAFERDGWAKYDVLKI